MHSLTSRFPVGVTNRRRRDVCTGSALPPETDSQDAIATRRKCAKQRHTHSGKNAYSITSLAVASRAGGTVRPSSLAVLRLITNSNFADCITGRSDGRSPLRIRPV